MARGPIDGRERLPVPSTWRYRRLGQPRQAREKSSSPDHPFGWLQTLLPAEYLPDLNQIVQVFVPGPFGMCAPLLKRTVRIASAD